MKSNQYLPVLLTMLVGIFAVFLIAFRASQASESPAVSYVIKETPQPGLVYVEPRFSEHIQLDRGKYFKSFDTEGLLSAIEEIAETYQVEKAQLHARRVDGNDVPGLFVFVSEKAGEAISQ
ncbi:hypothetical protein IQ241_22980 [Romeria aff. gracilis LEGE 07310]|uniref:Uncharacterized protein n=1 Tax=Vasconcelosia minhoensis LEGE 07310 TaxID=915328 RepID=A0A8J7DNK9_9CYAN|nr:hypothetical protein [Romeria gracilis]MBE9080121.1 hypothetical protein [Romeria aff. gracilis LEGE 07310]